MAGELVFVNNPVSSSGCSLHIDQKRPDHSGNRLRRIPSSHPRPSSWVSHSAFRSKREPDQPHQRVYSCRAIRSTLFRIRHHSGHHCRRCIPQCVERRGVCDTCSKSSAPRGTSTLVSSSLNREWLNLKRRAKVQKTTSSSQLSKAQQAFSTPPSRSPPSVGSSSPA